MVEVDPGHRDRAPDKERMATNEQWIDCAVAPGMFSDERAVEVQGQWFFVDARCVFQVEDRGPALLAAHVFEADGLRWAALPTTDRACVLLDVPS